MTSLIENSTGRLFTFDPEAAKDIDHMKCIVALKAQMNTDLLTEDLKKARSSNQSFWLMGQPDVELRPVDADTYQVEVFGFDYCLDTGSLRSTPGENCMVAVKIMEVD